MTAPELAPGVHVVVTQGLAAGVEGVVVAEWPRHFHRGGPRMWVVRSQDLVRQRILRADWLRPVEAAP